jgi:AraC-like DNA-binding protein
MIYSVFFPSLELQNIIRQYVVIDSFEGIERLLFLPNGGNFIVFNRGIEGCTQTYNAEKLFDIPKNYYISAKTNKVIKVVLHRQREIDKSCFPIILVELLPIGYYKLFQKDASLLNKGHLELENDITQRYFADLYTHESVQEELEYLNKSLEALHLSQNNSHLELQNVLSAITDSYDFEVTVKSLLEEFQYSRSSLERQFKKIIGFTPKNFIFISKFCKTVLAHIEEGCTFSELKYLYSDSSHLNAVFKKFLGMNPSEILREVAQNNIRIYQMQNLQESRWNDK